MKQVVICAAPALVASFFFTAASRAGTLDDIGLTALRAVTTNVDGSGIRVAQPEASLTSDNLTWLITPSVVGQPGSLFTYTSALGSTNVYPNLLGTNSWHAESVGNVIYGIPFGVATNLAHVDSLEAEFFYTNYVANPALPPIGDPIVNQSFTFGNEPDQITVAEQQEVDSEYDNYAATNGTLFVSAVNNGGHVSPPGTSYNCIGVAAYDIIANSSVGPTLDNGRCKPDITAPNVYTSFSTPYVSGAAALLMQAGRRGDGGSQTNPATDLRTVKALLLNGAVKPPGWTNGNATPLDARYGSGVLNILNSYAQLAGGKQSNLVTTKVSLNAAHPPTGDPGTVPVLSGWDFCTNTSTATNDAIKHYYFNVTNAWPGAKFTATATLVWNRHQNKTNLNNLDLFLYNCANSNLVNCSISQVDNVEHIYQTDLAPGRYDLQVWKAGGTSVSTQETYALAFEFFADTLSLAKSGTNTALTWPVYPAGFLVEATTNLTAPNWTTNNLPAAGITNHLNRLILNATNAHQFFRLRRPNL